MTPNNRLIVLAADIRAAHAEIEQATSAIAERVLATGQMLIEAKDRVRHGEWEAWLNAEAGVSGRTARRYMQLARAGLKTATVATLGICSAVQSIAKHGRKSRRRLALLDDANAAADAWLLDLEHAVPLNAVQAALDEIRAGGIGPGDQTLPAPDRDVIMRRHLSGEELARLALCQDRFERDVAPLARAAFQGAACPAP